jgi:hypothetical protein
MLPEEDFTTAPPGAPHPALPPACTLTKTYSKKHRWHQSEAGDVSSSEATEMQDPERDPATDLLGEEVSADSNWRSW